MNNLQKIREACIKANPDLVKRHCQCCGFEECDMSTTGCAWYVGRPITFADVLLVMKETDPEKIWGIDISSGEFFGQSMSDGSPIYHKGIHWNLKETLENQSEETLSFIAELV